MTEPVNPFLQYQREDAKDKNIFLDILQSVVIAVSLSLFLYLFIINPNEVDGPSMEPTFYTNELLFTSKLHAWFSDTNFGKSVGLTYKRGDVVVFQKPGFEDFIKRVIAIPGDTIAIKDGKYIVNGNALTETNFDINNLQRKDGSFLSDGDAAIKVEEDTFFVSGDNRDVSFDSRELGLIRREWIKGRVVFRFWPLDKFGYIGTGEFSESPQINITNSNDNSLVLN